MKASCASFVALFSVALDLLTYSASAQPVAPQDSGLTPRTPTTFINLPSIHNNTSTESLGVAIGQNGNVLVGWEDDGDGIMDTEAIWTMFNSSGLSITPGMVQTALDPEIVGQSISNNFLSYFRSNGSATPGTTSWGPKIKGNLFGEGFGMGATSFKLGLEVSEFGAINLDAGGGGDFPSVQLLTASGGPAGIVSGMSDADAEPEGDVRIGDWDYLANGNIVIVGESRQDEDRTNRFGMLTNVGPNNVAVYRIVTPAGTEVKAYGPVSAVAERNEIWHGVGVTANGFAVRFARNGAKVRMFDNAGNPTSEDIDLATLTGKPIAAGGGRGDGVGFHGNGRDAYVAVTSGVDEGKRQVWVTVLNADGTLRYSKALTDDLELTDADRVDAAIDADGRVLVVFDDSGVTGTRLVMGRVLDAAGNPAGRTFYVSEIETPTSNSLEARRPRVAWRGGLAAIVWESTNSPETQDRVVAMRLFNTSQVVTSPVAPQDSGLTPRTPTTFINLPSIHNNTSTESLGVAIGQNGNVLVGWEDDGDGIMDTEAIWTMFNSSGLSITPGMVQTALDPEIVGQSISNNFLSYFRSNGSATPGTTSWGPKIKGNLFGEGFGMGATSFKLGLEVSEFGAINLDAGGGGDFPSVQLLTASGGPAGIVSGMSDADAEPEGDVRIGDWDYLANGNIVIVGESRQDEDRTNRFGMLTNVGPNNVAVYRIVTPTGTEVKAYGPVSAVAERNEIWHGVGVTANGFAVRFARNGAKVRMFDNAGNPTSEDIDLATLTGKPIAAGGGRGDGVGFHGNGRDAYVAVTSGVDEGKRQVWVTVLNADGTLRYSKALTDDLELTDADRVDAAIDADGRVLVVFDDSGVTGTRLVMGRVLDAAGNPAGRTFYVSEIETPTSNSLEARRPRVAWRGGLAAIIWESKNSPETQDRVVAMRLFSTGPSTGDAPTLAISKSATSVTLSWPTSATGFVLQSTATLPGTWTVVSPAPTVEGNRNTVTLPIDSNARFFRLRK